MLMGGARYKNQEGVRTSFRFWLNSVLLEPRRPTKMPSVVGLVVEVVMFGSMNTLDFFMYERAPLT